MLAAMKPTMCVFRAFGGVRATARMLGLSPSTVSRWQRTGFIPSRHHANILAKAKLLNKRLTAKNLIYGDSK